MTTKTEFLRFKRLIKDAEALPISIKGTRSGSIERTAILRNRDAVVLKTKELIKRNKFLSKKCAEDLADLNGLEYHTKRGLLLEALYLAEKEFLILDPTLGSLTVRSIGKNNAEWSLIHHDIIKVSKQKFEDEHYADSVESAFKEINWSEPLRVDNELSNINSWREVHEKDEAALRPSIQDISSS